MRRLVLLCLGVGLLAARLTWAGPSEIAVRMKCPVLSEVSAAEFEARAKVDLSVRASRGGELEVICDALTAHIRWRAGGGAWVARSIPPTASPATLIDALLVASKELVEEASREEDSRAHAAQDERPATDSTLPNDSSAADAATTERNDGGEPLPKDRAEGRAAPREETATARDVSRSPSGQARTWAWGVTAGAGAAIFSLSGTGIVGPSVGVFAQLPAGFVTSLTAEYDVGLGAGDIVSVRVGSVAAVISAPFGPARAFEVGVGGLVGSVFASANAPYQPTSLAQAFGGAILRGRYALRWEGWRFGLGPDFRFYGFRPEVAIDDTLVWGVPAVSGGLSLEVGRAL